MLLGRHYQNAYVTRDLNAARKAIRAQGDIRQESEFEGRTLITTPRGEAFMETKIAFIWIGDLQFELIQPTGGEVGFYKEALPSNSMLAFHHLAMRVPDWDTFRAQVDRQPYKLVFEGEAGPIRFLYLDARADLGHYLEYTAMPDEVWTGMGGR